MELLGEGQFVDVGVMEVRMKKLKEFFFFDSILFYLFYSVHSLSSSSFKQSNTQNGGTPSKVAVKNNKVEAAKLLLDHGAWFWNNSWIVSVCLFVCLFV